MLNIVPKRIKEHSLTGRITSKVMMCAWKNVKRNRGSAGVDRMTVDRYAKKLDLHLDRLMKDLKTRGVYRSPPLKRVYIPKAGSSKKRPLGIPTISARIAQEVMRQLIDPIFEKQFHDNSFGFRSGRGCHQAVEQTMKYIRQGYRYVVDADIKGFFDNIPHKLIMDLLRSEIADGNVLDIIEVFLRSGVMEDGKRKPTEKGTPQGGVISPLLANIVLNRLDWALDDLGLKFVRYADDFVILCKTRSQAETALDYARKMIASMGLSLSEEKTHVGRVSEGFQFLGFLIKGKRHIIIREKSEEKLSAAIRDATRRSHNLDATVIRKLNRTIRGLVNYFGRPWAQTLRFFTKLDQWIRERLRSMKYKRKWATDHRRLKNKHLARLGLLSCRELCLAMRSQ